MGLKDLAMTSNSLERSQLFICIYSSSLNVTNCKRFSLESLQILSQFSNDFETIKFLAVRAFQRYLKYSCENNIQATTFDTDFVFGQVFVIKLIYYIFKICPQISWKFHWISQRPRFIRTKSKSHIDDYFAQNFNCFGSFMPELNVLLSTEFR